MSSLNKRKRALLLFVLLLMGYTVATAGLRISTRNQPSPSYPYYNVIVEYVPSKYLPVTHTATTKTAMTQAHEAQFKILMLST